MDSYFFQDIERVLRFPFMFNQVVDTSTNCCTTKLEPVESRNVIDVEFEEIKEDPSMDQDTIALPSGEIISRKDFEVKAIITTKEDYEMNEELKEVMDQVTQDMIQQDEENPNPRNPFVRKKRSPNAFDTNDIIAIRIFNDDGKTKADFRLGNGRIKRVIWNELEAPRKHFIMGGTIIFDERPKVTWEDLLK